VEPVINDSECSTKFSGVEEVNIIPFVYGGSKGYCSVAGGILIRKMRKFMTSIK
jgi:hypothetical protein